MEDREIMSFRDEDGNKVDFEAVARIYLKEQEYLLLAPFWTVDTLFYVTNIRGLYYLIKSLFYSFILFFSSSIVCKYTSYRSYAYTCKP